MWSKSNTWRASEYLLTRNIGSVGHPMNRSHHVADERRVRAYYALGSWQPISRRRSICLDIPFLLIARILLAVHACKDSQLRAGVFWAESATCDWGSLTSLCLWGRRPWTNEAPLEFPQNGSYCTYALCDVRVYGREIDLCSQLACSRKPPYPSRGESHTFRAAAFTSI